MGDGGGGRQITRGLSEESLDEKDRGKSESVELYILSIPTPSACTHIHHVNIPTAWPFG